MRYAKTACVACLAAGAALGWVAAPRPLTSTAPALSPRPSEPDRAADATANANLRPIQDAVSRIERRLTAIEDAVGQVQVAPPIATRTPADPEAPDLASELAELRLLVEHLVARADERDAEPSLNELKKENTETKWDAVQTLLNLWSIDEAAARRDVQLLSDKDVLRRFGSPSQMWSDDSSMHWFYRVNEDTIAQTYDAELYFRLKDGLVTIFDVAVK